MNFECHCILHEFLIRDGHYFYVSNWRWYRHFTWSSEPLKGLGACSAKGVPLLLSYFLTLHEYWSGPWNPPPPTLQSSTVPTEPSAVPILPKLYALIDLIY